MPIKSCLQAPPVAVVLAATLFLAMLLLRGTSVPEDPPFFSSPEENCVYVQLSGPGLSSGVYQLNDDLSILDVINLTVVRPGDTSWSTDAASAPVLNGAKYAVTKKEQKIEFVQRGWLPAGQRMALGIALHPDRMNRSDWVVLPGVGEKLAERIEIDRQKNGDFGSLDALARVRGIGPGKIESWRTFF